MLYPRVFVFQCLMASSYIPIYAGFKPVRIDGNVSIYACLHAPQC